MLVKLYGKINFVCDTCGDVLETGADADEFGEARQSLIDNAWKTSKHGADWFHTCDVCKNSKPSQRRTPEEDFG